MPGSPFAVALDADGTVLAKGTFNTGAQLESVLAAAERAPRGRPCLASATGSRRGTSRRGFLSRVSRRRAGADGRRRRSAGWSRPGEAEAYHFCGHIYTTDSCPHPTGLPRIDSRGLPAARARRPPVDDLGRSSTPTAARSTRTAARSPTPTAGRCRPPPARRVCDVVADRLRHQDRRSTAPGTAAAAAASASSSTAARRSPRRINGDASLTGYCYKGRKVFCVMYYDTKVKC